MKNRNAVNASILIAFVSWSSTVAVALADEVNSPAPNANMRYVSGSLLRDDQGSMQALGILSMTLGNNAWIMAGGGRSRSENGAATYRPNILTSGFGLAGDALRFALNVTDYKDGDIFRQRDWKGALEWRGAVMEIGVDGEKRTAHIRTTVSTPTSQNGTAYVTVARAIKGTGLGAHARVKATDQFSVFATGMKYHYTVTTQQIGTSTGSSNTLDPIVNNLLNDRQLLSQTTLTRTSMVTRDEAVLDNSLSVGATYQFEHAAFTGEYINDKVMDVPGSVVTVQIKAAINVAAGWQAIPGVGNSHSKQYGDVSYGFLTVSYGW